MSIETMQKAPLLRRFSVDDWQIYKTIRLEALEAEFYFFGGKYTAESLLSDEEWQARLSDEQTCTIWGLFDGDICIGLTGILRHNTDPGTVIFIASYIRREYRRQGLSALFYEARFARARELGYSTILIAHRDGNEASRAAILKAGFKYTHSEVATWADGSQNEKHWYHMQI